MADTPTHHADPFRPRSRRRLPCPRCDNGRLFQNLTLVRVHYECDQCSYVEVWTRRSPADPAQLDYINNPPIDLKPKRTRHGLTKRDYGRWIKCGKPPLAQFKAAGCPTPKVWRTRVQNMGDQTPRTTTAAPLVSETTEAPDKATQQESDRIHSPSSVVQLTWGCYRIIASCNITAAMNQLAEIVTKHTESRDQIQHLAINTRVCEAALRFKHELQQIIEEHQEGQHGQN